MTKLVFKDGGTIIFDGPPAELRSWLIEALLKRLPADEVPLLGSPSVGVNAHFRAGDPAQCVSWAVDMLLSCAPGCRSEITASFIDRAPPEQRSGG